MRVPILHSRHRYHRFFIWIGIVLLLLSGIWSGIPGKVAGAEAGTPITPIYPAEAITVKPNELIHIQVAAPGWPTVEIWEGGQFLGASATSSGPNHVVPIMFTTEGVHTLQARALNEATPSVSRQLPPIVVKTTSSHIDDIVPLAKQLGTNTVDYNGDGQIASDEDKWNDLRAALHMIRPTLPAEFAGPATAFVLQPGPDEDSIRIHSAAPAGTRWFYKMFDSYGGSHMQPIPQVGSTASAYGAEYTAGNEIDITYFDGIESYIYYDYIALTQADAAGKVVKFSNVPIRDTNVLVGYSGYVRDSINADAYISDATIEFRSGKDNTTGPIVDQKTTGTYGGFSALLPGGDYTARLVKVGFEDRGYNIRVSRDDWSTHELLAVATNGPFEYKGVVRDSTNNYISGATIEIRAGQDNTTGPTVSQTTTDVNGGFSVLLPEGDYTGKLIAQGFEAQGYNIHVSRNDGTIHVLIAVANLLLDEYRIVLTWDESPRDLDSHLIGPDGSGGIFHVYYGYKIATNGSGQEIAKLNHDDTNSNGNETVTIMTVAGNVYGTYKYYVHNYSSYEGTPLVGSTARVQVFKGVMGVDNEVSNQPIQTYTVPSGLSTDAYWSVLNMIVSETGVNLSSVNQLQSTVPGLSKITSAAPSPAVSLNSLKVYFSTTGSWAPPQLVTDLAVTAKLNGSPYTLSNVNITYNGTEGLLTFDPVAGTTSAQQLEVTVSAAADSSLVIPSEASHTFTIPAQLSAASFITPNTISLNVSSSVTNLTVSDLTVSASVYNTVTQATYSSTLNNLVLSNNGGWTLTFDPIFATTATLKLTVTISANPTSTTITGSATTDTATIEPSWAFNSTFEHLDAALALLPPPPMRTDQT
ncbi:MAG: hypothetical protein K0Q59_1763 [Paenibacillus sp.]|nr:hypothetical protein [Paenibacillus sp.]